MRTRQENGLWATIGVWIAFFAVLQGGTALAAKSLTRAEVTGYSQWLGVLAEDADAPQLYPLGKTEAEIAAESHERRLAAARALIDYDASAIRAWNAADFRNEFQSVNHARGSREILDFDGALQWYRTALQARAPRVADGVLTREIFATAVMSGDSLQILEQLLNLVGVADLKDRSAAVVLAYRHYLHERDRTNLDLLMEKVAPQLAQLPTEIVFWHAFCLIHLERRAEAEPLLERLACDATLAAALAREQVEWFVQALPDNLTLLDRHRDAHRLYRLLGARADTPAGRWARYQLANAYLLEGRYDQAAPLYAEACDAAEPASWQIRACALAETATALEEIRKEGERYDTDDMHDR